MRVGKSGVLSTFVFQRSSQIQTRCTFAALEQGMAGRARGDRKRA